MLQSGISVAAHAHKAFRARSDSKLSSKLDVLLQEADETQLWLELLLTDTIQEAGELIAIFTTILSKIRRSL